VKTRTNKNVVFILLALGTLTLVSACTLTEPIHNDNRGAIEQALKDSLKANRSLRSSTQHNTPIQNALMPDININLPNVPTNNKAAIPEQRFDIAANNTPAKDFFMGLVKDTDYNMTVNPQITGNISLKLKSVTIPQTMDAVRDTYGFEYGKTSYGYIVYPRRLETRVFNLNYIDLDRSGHSRTTVGSGQITNTVQNTPTSTGVSTSQQPISMPSGIIQTDSSSKFWDLLKQNLETIIGTQEGRSVIVNPRSGVIIVRAYPNELRYVAQYLDNIQSIIHRQVIIEAKILEVRLGAQFQNGINWRVLGLQQGEINSSEATNSIQETFADKVIGVLNIRAKSGGEYESGSNAFSSVIRLLNNQGKVNVLSSPRIATINNQKAVIKVGTDKFFVTNVSSDTNLGTSTSQTTANITLTPFFSGITLDVTPQIDENDFVTIHIHPIVSDVVTDRQKFTVNNQPQDLPLAKSTIKESDSVVRAKNGQVIVIGGLIESSLDSVESSTPGVDRLPGVGGLFKSKKKNAQKRELVILLRPTIAEDTRTWQKQLQEAVNNLQNMPGNFSYEVVPTKQKKNTLLKIR
jgi:MSHA biogenesis protein MshL